MSTNSIFICCAVGEEQTRELGVANSIIGKIQNLIVSSETAIIQGSVYRSKVGFPVLCKEPKDYIKGSVLRVVSSEITLHILNELMGFSAQNLEHSLTLLETINVETSVGFEEVYVYFLNPAKMSSELKYIEHGDWEKVLSEKPPIPKKLNERQRNYIQKLGKSSGREIVPIDLALYRELMNLELVIDKGRRIALTKLGQEVYSYL